VTYLRAARALRVRILDVVEGYRVELLRVDSPLATRPEAWQQCRRQALSVLGECAKALECSEAGPPDEAREYARLLGSHRALQQIPAAESVRAVEILWSVLEPAVHQAAAQVGLAQRPEVWKAVNAAFRAATGERLHAGLLGYEEARGRILVAAAPAPAAPGRSGEPGEGAAQEEPPPELTAREREVLDAVALAMTNRQIARRLGIREPTVKRHLSNIFRKLGASSRMDAVYRATELNRRHRSAQTASRAVSIARLPAYWVAMKAR
jgi:DNA-binding CsgD family transcriptional regulator